TKRTRFTELTKKTPKPSDHLVFCCNILTNSQLTTNRLSANCLDGLKTRDNCQAKGNQMNGIRTTGIA
ncbi:MAG: hypothetical protein ACOCM5_02730, partial [Prevotella pectinovora]